MPLVKIKPMRFRPRSLSDTLDGTNSPPGSALAFVNLIADPSTPACLQCRPAAEILSQFSGFTSPGLVTAALEVNGRIYGLIGSGRFSGHDEPFCFNVASEEFVTLSGVTSGNCPLTPVSTGDWVPPSMFAVGQKVLVTHPGFQGLGNGNFFGYFDTSAYTETENGNTTSGSNQITGNILITAVGPGYSISGTGIPAGSTVTNVVSVTLQTTGNTTASSTTVSNVASFAGIAVGQTIAGLGIPTAATIAGFNVGAATITLSAAATSSNTAATLSMSGTIVTISANATATATVAVTISGGTTTEPLWCAGNTTNILLPSAPQQVSGFNNRPYFAVGNAVTFCDPLSLNISEADGNPQTLTIGDTSPVTCLTPLTIINPATAAPVSGLLTFKEKLITLITGDPTTSNLANNTLSSAGIGTVSPLAVSPTQIGVFFPAADGLRCVELSGNITDPLPDVRVPFISAINKTRMSGAYNSGVYRCCLQSGTLAGSPFQEYWFDLTHKMWNGPHTFQQNIITTWEGTFIAFSNANAATLYQTDVIQGLTSSFTENGSVLNWNYTTCALPDNEDLMMNSLVVSTINMAYAAGASSIQFLATDENGTTLGQALLTPPSTTSIWGDFNWGAGLWFGQIFGLQPKQIPWTAPIVFSKLILQVSSLSSTGVKISNYQALYQPLGYIAQSIGNS
jgi:hypothetical protein